MHGIRLKLKTSENNQRSKLYRLLSPHIELIQKQYPKVTKNSCGYRLDAVISNEKFWTCVLTSVLTLYLTFTAVLR
jgi:hypothetical protein